MANVMGTATDHPVAPFSQDYLIIKLQEEEDFITKEQSANE
jgi:hypothetical protein